MLLDKMPYPLAPILSVKLENAAGDDEAKTNEEDDASLLAGGNADDNIESYSDFMSDTHRM